jgi:general secretion pathway protein N
MINCNRVLGLTAGFVTLGHALALGATPPLATSPYQNPISQGVIETSPESGVAASPAVRERPVERPPVRGNPLWAVPLRSLSVTRERPIFSPSRRPPPPAVMAAPYVPPAAPPPPRPEEPDHPPLALVGTVVGESESIGIFFDQSAQSVIRLRAGEGYSGWILRTVQGREATFERGRRAATLTLPASGGEQGGVSPVASTLGAQPGATWTDGDGRMITPPPGRMSPPPPLAAAQVDAGVRASAAEP